MTFAKQALGAMLVGWASLGALLCQGCKGCGKDSSADAAPSPAALVNRTEVQADAGPTADRDLAMWTRARTAEEGSEEDLMSLAVHEGAAGLVEAATIPELRVTALRAMAYADGFAQLPTLAEVASGGDDAQAIVALSSAVTMGQRPRRQVAAEDAEELEDGCAKLGALATNEKAQKNRRVLAIRALRTLPCKGDFPHDLDAH